MACLCDAATGYDGMYMGMEPELLSPCMEHGDHAHLCAEVFRVSSQRFHATGTGFEEHVVESFGIAEAPGVEHFGQRKDNMEIGCVQQVVLSGENPSFPVCSLTLGAVAVSA